MPFGAALGALQFLQVSYLWSVELWSAIISREFQRRKKTFFVGLIITCITVAAAAGPSSANLLIPRQGIWSKQSRYLSVNASFQDLWPDRLEDGRFRSDCITVRHPFGDDKHHCPIELLNGLYESQSIKAILDMFSNDLISITQRFSGVPYGTNLLLAASNNGNSKIQVYSSCPQQVLVPGLITDLKEASGSYTKLEDYHVLENDYYQPYTAANCEDDTVQDDSDQGLLRFARILETEKINQDQDIVSVPGLTKSRIIDEIPGNSSQYRVGWVDLPQEIFSTRVPGAVIVHPHNPSNSSYKITTCTLNAGWGSSTLMNDNINFNTVESHISHTSPSWPKSTVALDPYGYMFTSAPNFGNSSQILYPQKRVSISKSWMDFINPTIIQTDNSTSNAFSYTLLRVTKIPNALHIAMTINILLATTLSANGLKHNIAGIYK